MKLSKNTILITGGSSGIGLELVKRLIERGNEVIICGRSEQKLKEAEVLYPSIQSYQCDISNEEQLRKFAGVIHTKHPQLNILINNAAIVHVASFEKDNTIIDKAKAEVNTNLLAPIILTKLLLPLLMTNKNAQVINITTGLVFAPRIDYPFYNATKAALHSFTQTLRGQLKDTNLKVTEVLFPAVDTPWHNGNPPRIAISIEKAVGEMIRGIEKRQQEINVGRVKMLYILSRLSPNLAMRIINGLNKTH